MTAELPGQGGCKRFPVHARIRRPPAASAGARPRCQRRPDQPKLLVTAEAHREAKSTRQSPKAKPEAVENLDPSDLNCSPKCSLSTKASVEASVLSIVNVECAVDCKCQTITQFLKPSQENLICNLQIYSLCFFLNFSFD